MPLTPWTDARLTRLFERYRQRYWPTSRRLRAYRIQLSSLKGIYGRCDWKERVLHVDAAHHPSDREVRATVLHEMIHAALGSRDGGHGAAFWAELERLLARRAPVTIGFPELGEQGRHLHVIPPRFRRCRRLFRRVYERQQRALARLALGRDVTLTPGHIETECEDAASAGARWKAIWTYQVRTYGFVTLDGEILPWAVPYQRAARRGYRRGRQFFLEDQRMCKWFQAARLTARIGDGVGAARTASESST